MVARKLTNYLKTYRKRSRLTQEELAYLLGYKSGTVVGLHEQGVRLPSFHNLVAYEAILATDCQHLFAGSFQEIAENARKRARKLLHKLSSQPLNPVTSRKIDFLKQFLSQEVEEEKPSQTS